MCIVCVFVCRCLYLYVECVHVWCVFIGMDVCLHVPMCVFICRECVYVYGCMFVCLYSCVACVLM